MVRVGVTRMSTSVKIRSSVACHSRWACPGRARRARSKADPSSRRSRTSAPMPSGSSSDQGAVGLPRLDHQEQAGLRSRSSHPGRRGRGTSHPVSCRARSMAAVMAGSASTGSRATARSAPAASATVNPARAAPSGDQPGDVAGHRPDGVEARRERPHPVERDPAPRRLETGGAAAGGWDTDRATGIAAVGDVGFSGGDRDRRAARRATGDEGGVERVHRRAVPRVHARHAEGQLVQVRAPDDPGPGRPGAGQAARRRCAAGAARSATARQPAVVGSPPMSIRSLTARRTPGPEVS